MKYNECIEKIGETIKEERERKKISQEQLIAMLQDRKDGSSIGRNKLVLLEQGKSDDEDFSKKELSVEDLHALEKALGIEIIGKRLKEARIAKGLSREQLIQETEKEKNDSSIGKNTLVALENGRGKDTNFSLKTLYALGEILGVDVGYLIGEQEYKSLNRRDIENFIGLSDEAIELLIIQHRYLRDNNIANMISTFLSSPNLYEILQEYYNFRQHKEIYDDRHNNYEQCRSINSKIIDGSIDLGKLAGVDPDNELDFAKQLAKDSYTEMYHNRKLKLNYKEALRSLLTSIEVALESL